MNEQDADPNKTPGTECEGRGADSSRRRFLTAATALVGSAGMAAVAVPFIKSLEPDAAEEAESILTVDISELEPGMHLTTGWQQKPLLIVHRTPEMLATLEEVTPFLLDPDCTVPQQPPYAANIYRAREPEWLVMMFVCTHLCCTPLFKPDKGSVRPDWLGGFHCPCHGSLYDLSGRVFKDVPAPRNIVVPEYEFVDGGKHVRVSGLYKGSKLC
jgi:ubiquinol-cytochrome c reductase iron-sulfur subunit